MQNFYTQKFILLIFLLSIFIQFTTINAAIPTIAPTQRGGFVQSSETAYLNGFSSIIQNSYQVPLPSALKQACVTTDHSLASNMQKVTISNSVNAATAQSLCGSSSLCIIGTGATLTMDGNLNVAALLVLGRVIWTDTTQTTSNQWLCAGYVVMEGFGQFNMSITNPIHTSFIYLKDNGATHNSTLQTRVFGGIKTSVNSYPIIDVTGRPMSRTWSLLASYVATGVTSISLLHNPIDMGWQVGDRIMIASMATLSQGWGSNFTVIAMDPSTNSITISAPTNQAYSFQTQTNPSGGIAILSAEVINLSRNVIITGDDFRHIPCNPLLSGPFNTKGCNCNSAIGRTTCTLGLHTVLSDAGLIRIQYTRVEKCGQRGIRGKYCLHMHFLGKCPNCLFKGNALEYGHQRGIIVHSTHMSTVEGNVLNDIRGAGIFIENGNEMYNHINYNVMICPWPLNSLTKHGCTIPGTDNSQADTSLNQAGIWSITSANYVIGNRAANSFNGMFYDNGDSRYGDQVASGHVDTFYGPLMILMGNTFHGHGRFGTYVLNYFPKQNCTANVNNNGYFTGVQPFCQPFMSTGDDHGFPVVISESTDYSNAFVGGYDVGDVEYSGHMSFSNLNNIYWKTTKNIQDGCSAHITGGHYDGGNMALPDNAAFIIENTLFTGQSHLETNHHCNVGATGFLCMPTYVFSNVQWVSIQSTWVQWSQVANNYGGILVLAPPEQSNPTGAGGFFPPGYNSLVSKTWTYLLASGLNGVCSLASNISTSFPGMTGAQLSTLYGGGIVCTQPLRSLRVYAQGLTLKTAVSLVLKIYNRGVFVTSFGVPFHQIGADGSISPTKQGYAFPVLSGSQYEYKLSLNTTVDSGELPTNWMVVFSDPVFGNRWTPDYITLTVAGQNCNSKVVSSQHDRRWLHASNVDYLYPNAYNGGACSSNPNMPAVTCPAIVPAIDPYSTCASSCPQGCSNGYCDCGLQQCVCKPGYYGPSCQSNVCDGITCGLNGHCVAKYLGGQLAPSLGSCVCNAGWSGPTCDQNPCTGQTCSGRGICVAVGDTGFTCQCEVNYSGKTCQNTCTTFGCGSPYYPYSCAQDMPGNQQICLKGGGCQYLTTFQPTLNSNQCCYNNCDACDLVTCPPATTDCYLGGSCNSATGKCGAQLVRPDGSACNSVPFGQCKSGNCIKAPDPPTMQPTFGVPSVMPMCRPTFRPTVAPSVQVPTQGKCPLYNGIVSPCSGCQYCPDSSMCNLCLVTLPPVKSSGNIVTMNPSAFPSKTPTMSPTKKPTNSPSNRPTAFPSVLPTVEPSSIPSCDPSVLPSVLPSINPTVSPSSLPSSTPSSIPSASPTSVPTTHRPTVNPSLYPSMNPNAVSKYPSFIPTNFPSKIPTISPSSLPSSTPSITPSEVPTQSPSESPSCIPTSFPSSIPTIVPTSSPTMTPTDTPSESPTLAPTVEPSITPSIETSIPSVNTLISNKGVCFDGITVCTGCQLCPDNNPCPVCVVTTVPSVSVGQNNKKAAGSASSLSGPFLYVIISAGLLVFIGTGVMLYRYKKTASSADYDDGLEKYAASHPQNIDDSIPTEENPFHRPSENNRRKSEVFGYRVSDQFASPTTLVHEEFLGDIVRRNSRGSNPLDVHNMASLRARRRSSSTGIYSNSEPGMSPPVSARSGRNHGVTQLSLGIAALDSTALLSDRDEYDDGRSDSLMSTPRAPGSSRSTTTPSIYQIAVDSFKRLTTPRSAFVSPRVPYHKRDDSEKGINLHTNVLNIDDGDMDEDEDLDSLDENAPLSARANLNGSKKRL